MSKSTTQITPEAADVVRERGRMWDEYDSITARSAEIRDLAAKVGSATEDLPEIAPLTTDQTPPQEIGAAIAEMRLELDAIARLTQEIGSREQMIQQIRSRISTIYIVGGILFTIFLVWLLSVVL